MNIRKQTIIFPKENFIDRLLKKFNIERKIIIPKIENNNIHGIVYARKESIIRCLMRVLLSNKK